MKIPPANDKLREAEFFFVMMEKGFETYELGYGTKKSIRGVRSPSNEPVCHSPMISKARSWN
ncbi:MAG: hypothetical protein ABSH45_04000 [Bryobacteraceae bacterium]|jgi:hypothetical protein